MLKKKMINAIICGAMATVMLTTPALAGNISYAKYSFAGSKYDYNIIRNTYSYNTKAVTGRDWVVNASVLSYTDKQTVNHYGIAHALFVSGSDTPVSQDIWLKTPKRETGKWKSGQGKAGTKYCIGVRLDSVLSGTGTTAGVFNSDAY